MRKLTGQTSLELLILLSIAVVIITVMMVLAQGQIGDLGRLKEQSDAQNALWDISAAAKDVYAQGEGAKKKVYVDLPSSYDPAASSVGGRLLKLNVRGTDFAAVEDFDVHGSWPGTDGGHWVWVISEGNKVRIGSAMITLSKNSIYLLMERNSSASVSFDVESIWESDIDVDVAPAWMSANVVMTLSDTSFQLTPGSEHTMTLWFDTNEHAYGYNSGELRITADDGVNNETLRLPITVEIVGTGTVLDPPLNVTPDFWMESLQPTNSSSETFTVCTNMFTAPTSVTFAPTAGAPGDWVWGTAPLGPMSSSSCEQKELFITVPNGTAPGKYEGSIQVVGEGVLGAEDTISLFVVVQDESGTTCFANESTSPCNCPVGSNYWGVPTCNCIPANLYVLNGTVHGGPDDGKPYNGTLVGGAGADIIAGTDDADIIYTSSGNDMICGHGGDDIIYGSNSNDYIDGGEGADMIYGEGSNDVIYGKGGNDIIYGDQGDDEIDAGAGDDLVYGGAGKDLIYGGAGNDQLHGEDGQDLICGNSGSDILKGEVGNDDMDGGSGSDMLDGGLNSDTCYVGETVTNCESLPGGYHSQCGPS